MDTTLILLVLLAVLLLVNLIISSVVLSKLNKNKDGYKSSFRKQDASVSSRGASSAMSQ